MRTRLFSVSIDLDPLRCYHEIHGLSPLPGDSPLVNVVLQRALPRFLALCDELGIAATLFVVGEDLHRDALGRETLRQAAQAGHELANHSFAHPYALSRLDRAVIEREVGDCHLALQALTGQAPVGFRAPGYEISAELVDVLEAFGYRYDSSLFPCPPYYAAKLAVLGRMKLSGMQSTSIIGDPRAQLGPSQPYRMNPRAPHQVGHGALIELPIAVTRFLRLPAIGTSLLLKRGLRWAILAGMRQQPVFNLELHGMDLLDADADGIPEPLRSKQPDLRVPLDRRLAALREVISSLAGRARAMRLCDLAEAQRRHL